MNRTARRASFVQYLAWASVLAVGCAPAAPRAHTRSPTGEIADATSIDFARVRAEYGDREDFRELCENGRPLKEFIELTNAGRFAEVLAISQPWVSKCPVDIDAHFVTAIALTELGKPHEAEKHIQWYRGLIDSVLASGDGKSAETAFTVISVEEEYAILRAVKLHRKSQALSQDKIDILTVEGESGESTIFFNPAAHFRRLNRALGIVE
jgi:hypothetical protein